MTWDGQVVDVRVGELGPYAYSKLSAPDYPPCTCTELLLGDYPPYIRSQMVVPGWRFRWTITKDVDRLDPVVGSAAGAG